MGGFGRSRSSFESSIALFEEHSALFMDKEDGDVYPRTFENRDAEAVEETFNAFYSYVATYELSRQWIVEPGQFNCEFSWLTTKYTQDEIDAWASGLFKSSYGVDLEDFVLTGEPSDEAVQEAQKRAASARL